VQSNAQLQAQTNALEGAITIPPRNEIERLENVMRSLVLTLLVLSGCTALPSSPPPEVDTRGPLPPSTRPAYNLAGYPAEFKDGYIDGCETAKGSQFGWKDPRRFEADKQYRQGWQDGNQICSAKR